MMGSHEQLIKFDIRIPVTPINNSYHQLEGLIHFYGMSEYNYTTVTGMFSW